VIECPATFRPGLFTLLFTLRHIYCVSITTPHVCAHTSQVCVRSTALNVGLDRISNHGILIYGIGPKRGVRCRNVESYFLKMESFALQVGLGRGRVTDVTRRSLVAKLRAYIFISLCFVDLMCPAILHESELFLSTIKEKVPKKKIVGIGWLRLFSAAVIVLFLFNSHRKRKRTKKKPDQLAGFTFRIPLHTVRM